MIKHSLRVFRCWFGVAAILLSIGHFSACRSGKAPLAGSVPPKIELEPALLNYENAILEFEQMELDSPSQKGGIVFTGSSSIRKWETLAADMAPLPVINRGFGGAIIRQVSYYAERMIIPLAPKLIVFYCGENDICNEVYPYTDPLDNFKDFVAIIRHYLPETHILYLSMKPSPRRWEYWEKYKKGNALIEKYTETDAQLCYLDVAEVMLAVNGRPKTQIWASDSLHMNAEGYADWAALVRPLVEEMWGKVQETQGERKKREEGKARNTGKYKKSGERDGKRKEKMHRATN